MGTPSHNARLARYADRLVSALGLTRDQDPNILHATLSKILQDEKSADTSKDPVPYDTRETAARKIWAALGLELTSSQFDELMRQLLTFENAVRFQKNEA